MSDEDGMAEVLVAFQCKTCSLIVGDSVNLMHVNEARRTVTLKYAVNIIRSTVAIHAAAGGEDAGNTYHELLCRQCKRILGKWYSATVPAFDAYRMAYTLHADDVTEYAVGANAPEDQWSMEGAVAVDEWKANVLHMRDLSKRLAKVRVAPYHFARVTSAALPGATGPENGPRPDSYQRASRPSKTYSMW
ncbi:hypothetical protein DYB32_004905 [Aphanomyces invadans]|uniref:Mis18 domain-containing protein n=1 Tax=Aphanomyces invadans TaxID=157072 RepID=A0A3R6Y8Y0_9STRA|nr:hypothetical protein DYB32_004905 [Aphanomyces invadans]